MEGRRVDDGWVVFRNVTPVWEQKRTAAGIILPLNFGTGKGYTKQVQDANGYTREKQITPDESTIYGRVIASGLKANRGSCEALAADKQGDYPLPAGTYFQARKVNSWCVGNEEQAINCWELVQHFLPGSPPDWAPKD